jgi:hypothetical protein
VAAENVAMGGAPLFQGVLQGAGDMLLPDHFGELLRPIFTRQDGVAHEPEETIIRDRMATARNAGFALRLAKSAAQAIGWCVNSRISCSDWSELDAMCKGALFLCN